MNQPPTSLGKCFTPRTLNQAFGPYARLNVERRTHDRSAGVGAWCVALAVVTLVVSSVL